jgi:hypothetical protein
VVPDAGSEDLVDCSGTGACRCAIEGPVTNGWALYGLAQSLKLQSRSAEASTAQQQLDTAWKNADAILVASAF